MCAPSRNGRGTVLIIGLVLAALLAVLSMTFASRIGANQTRVEADIAASRALELAQTASTLKIATLWSQFKSKPTNLRVPWLGGEDANGNGVLDNGEDANANGQLDGPNAPSFSDAGWVAMGSNGDTCTRVSVAALGSDSSWTDIRFTTWSRVPDDLRGSYAYRKIQRTIRYALGAANVFEYAYFANNYGWMYGTNLNVFGPMGANANLGFAGTPFVDGTLYAASNPTLGAAGIVTGTAGFDNFAQYQVKGTGDPLLRPTNPAGPNTPYLGGYDGTQPHKTQQAQETMPFLGDLTMYMNLASGYVRPARNDLGETGGTSGSVVKQLSAPGLDPTNPANYTILIDKTYGYNSEPGFTSNVSGSGLVTQTNITKPLDITANSGWKNGNVALIGTPQQPLVILGPVVISNDLVIKGTITGQGTFYVGRNTHVVGDMTYKAPPAWIQNDPNFATTAMTNKTKDAVGFAVKGNVVMGNYTDADTNADGWSSATSYIKPPFTQTYPVDKTDNPIGYGDGSSTATFSGNYTAIDGGKFYNDDNTAPVVANRLYYQSSFSKAYIKSIALAKPTNVHGIFYTNHYFGGRVQNFKLFGAMVARDEAIVATGSASFIWDARSSRSALNTYINLYLPRAAVYATVMWKECPADDATTDSPDW